MRMIRYKASWLSAGAFAFDLCTVAGTWLAACSARFNGVIPCDFWHGALEALAGVSSVYAVMFRAFGLYRGMWVCASLPDLIRISKSVAVGALIVMIGAAMLQPSPIIPRSVLIVSPLLLFLTMGGARALYRAIKEFYLYGGLIGKGKPVIVLGAGTAGGETLLGLPRPPPGRVVGLLDSPPRPPRPRRPLP